MLEFILSDPWIRTAVVCWLIVQCLRFVFKSTLAPAPSTTTSRGLNMGLCVSIGLLQAARHLTPFIGDEPTEAGYYFAGFAIGCGVTFGHLGISRLLKAAWKAFGKRFVAKARGPHSAGAVRE